MNRLTRGILISIEGIDGSGKSTLARNIFQSLHKKFPCVLTKEPGGSQLGQQLRTILQTQTVPVCAKAEYLLFAADRAQHFYEVIIPHLQNNTIIISDRMADSSLVYQGYGRGLDLDMIAQINNWTMQGIQPDITFYVDISADEALKRLKQRTELTVFEKEQLDFTYKLIHGFTTIFKDRKNVIPLLGTESREILTLQAIEKIIAWIKEHKIQR